MWNCIGVRSRLHSASLFWTLASLFSFTLLLCPQLLTTKRLNGRYPRKVPEAFILGGVEMSPIDRRTFLKAAGALGLAGLAAPVMPGLAATFVKRRNPIQHIIIDLHDTSLLCLKYLCSLLGPTWPNRFYTAARTSGVITTNGIWRYGVFDYPIILDLLDAANVSWKVYNVGMDSVPFGNTDNVFVFWKRFANDQRAHRPKQEFFQDLKQDTLPNVSWIIPSFARGWDEHPPADVSVGME